MRVFRHRQGQPGGIARIGIVAVEPLHDPPAVVLPAGAAGRLEVDLLVRVLPHVGDVEVGGEPVEGETPRIANAKRPDLRPPGGIAGERIGGRDGVRVGTGLHVDAQDLAQQRVRILGAVLGVTARAAVAHADVEVAVVGAEGELAAVVVGVRLGDHQQDLLAGRIGDVGVGRDRDPRDHRGAVAGAGVVDIKVLLRGIAGRKGDAQQALLAAGDDLQVDVQEPGRLQHPADHQPDVAGLLDHEDPAGAVAGVGDLDDVGHAVEKRHQGDGGPGGGRLGRLPAAVPPRCVSAARISRPTQPRASRRPRPSSTRSRLPSAADSATSRPRGRWEGASSRALRPRGSDGCLTMERNAMFHLARPVSVQSGIQGDGCPRPPARFIPLMGACLK